jgi:cyclophilin family peptidyl-prolyl cis-trans isomerase
VGTRSREVAAGEYTLRLVGTDKRERQKSNKLNKVAEEHKARQAAVRKAKIIRYSVIAAVAAVAIIAIAVLSRPKAKTAADITTKAPATTVNPAGTPPPTQATTPTTAAAAGSPKTAGKFVYGTGECAAADGSSPKTDKFSQPPRQCIDLTKTYTATVETTKGIYKALLDTKVGPGTVNNFVNLARFHYFDATPCHRIVKGFMAQCGDPTGKGTGGPGYAIPDELPAASADYTPGTLAMANSGPNTSGSQFFTMFRAGLQPSYSIFGHVTEGLDTTVKALDGVGNPGDGAPTEPVSITKVTITES